MYIKNEEDIKEMKLWLRETKFLPKDLPSDIIHMFLASTGGDKAKTKLIISNYYHARQSTPEVFINRHSILNRNFPGWKGSCFFPLKKGDGCRIFLGAVLDSTSYDFQILVKQMYMCYDLLIMSNDWDPGNRILIFSFQNLKYENLASFTMYLTKKSMELQTRANLPGKLKIIHNVYAHPFMKKIIVGFKETLKGENCEILLHKTPHSLHSYIKPELLPLELGGTAGSLEYIANKWLHILRLHKRFFMDEELKRMQETKTCTN